MVLRPAVIGESPPPPGYKKPTINMWGLVNRGVAKRYGA